MKENKARPVFTRCEPAFLLENSPARTYVTQVQATDEDSQEPGAITYQMVGLENKLKFNVDPINGTITSDYVILHTHTHTHTHTSSSIIFMADRSGSATTCVGPRPVAEPDRTRSAFRVTRSGNDGELDRVRQPHGLDRVRLQNPICIMSRSFRQ